MTALKRGWRYCSAPRDLTPIASFFSCLERVCSAVLTLPGAVAAHGFLRGIIVIG